jgi:hypothetical protein
MQGLSDTPVSGCRHPMNRGHTARHARDCGVACAQDLGAKSIAEARQLLAEGLMRMECRTGAAQSEGGVHDMLTFEKKAW